VSTDVLTRVATVRAAIAPMHLEPGIASVQVSQQLAGHDVELLDEHDDWHLVRGKDDYRGWVHRGYLAFDEEEMRLAGARARMSLGCVVATDRGGHRALPLRAFLAADERVIAGETIDAEEIVGRYRCDAASIVESAQRLFVGTSYQWGGITPWGADCSGFVQAIFALHGVALPRDAWQQASSGVQATTGILDSKAADLLFFSDRADQRITHVALALGDRRVAHVALGRGGFAVEHLEDGSDGYVAKLRARFLFARKVL
jgi:hypothetical protein